MSIEQNKQVVTDLLEAHRRFDKRRIGEILSPSLEWHLAGDEKPHGREDYLAGMEMGHEAFPDMTQTVEDMIAEGDRVAVRLLHRMTHTGPFMGMPPTGKRVTFRGTWFYRIADGKIVEAWMLDQDFTSQLRAK